MNKEEITNRIEFLENILKFYKSELTSIPKSNFYSTLVKEFYSTLVKETEIEIDSLKDLLK